MASEPTVCCVMLTKDRPAMAARAVASFRAQTYERKILVVYDTGKDQQWFEDPWENERHFRCFWNAHRGMLTIGQLRNEANGHALCDIIAHWDDDDYSHPNRLAEQVALLQASGADLVGYNEALFWDTRQYCFQGCDEDESGYYRRAWLYRNPNPTYALGTSFCYRRKTWEAHPFDHISHGEDERFRVKVKCFGIESLGGADPYGEPRMICSIHGSNTSPFDPAKAPVMCRRVPEWDSYCAERMRL